MIIDFTVAVEVEKTLFLSCLFLNYNRWLTTAAYTPSIDRALRIHALIHEFIIKTRADDNITVITAIHILKSYCIYICYSLSLGLQHDHNLIKRHSIGLCAYVWLNIISIFLFIKVINFSVNSVVFYWLQLDRSLVEV